MNTNEMFNEVAKLYEMGLGRKSIAKELGISSYKVTKILATLGEHTDTGRLVNNLIAQGKTLEEIATELEVDVKSLAKFIPYSKCVYNVDTPTENAIRIRKCRYKKSTNGDSER